MGHNFNTDPINIFISYKKLEKNPAFFPDVDITLLNENLSCAEIQSPGLNSL